MYHTGRKYIGERDVCRAQQDENCEKSNLSWVYHKKGIASQNRYAGPRRGSYQTALGPDQGYPRVLKGSNESIKMDAIMGSGTHSNIQSTRLYQHRGSGGASGECEETGDESQKNSGNPPRDFESNNDLRKTCVRLYRSETTATDNTNLVAGNKLQLPTKSSIKKEVFKRDIIPQQRTPSNYSRKCAVTVPYGTYNRRHSDCYSVHNSHSNLSSSKESALNSIQEQTSESAAGNQGQVNRAYQTEDLRQTTLDINDSIFDYSMTASISERSSPLSTSYRPHLELSTSSSSSNISQSRPALIKPEVVHTEVHETLMHTKVPASPIATPATFSTVTESHLLNNSTIGKLQKLPVPIDKFDNTKTAKNISKLQIPQFFLRKFRQTGDTKETLTDDGSMSFDIDDTILTLESVGSDADLARIKVQSNKGVTENERDIDEIKKQLDNLTVMYYKMSRNINQKHISNTRRPRSIGSSEASSLIRESKTLKSKSLQNKILQTRHRKRRFQRLESNVITVSQNLTSLASQIHSYSGLFKQIDTLKQEVRDTKQYFEQFRINNKNSSFGNTNNNLSTNNNNNSVNGFNGSNSKNSCNQSYIRKISFEKFRCWLPSLTNRKRVHKLTRFFGEEPPLLEIFLQKLGYERYASNFSNEHIGMLELPYMTEDRLKSIGIPMGPRLRILQEAQLCFRQENFDIYII